MEIDSFLLFCFLVALSIAMWRSSRRNKRRWAENESRWEVLRQRVTGLELAVKQLIDRSSKAPPGSEAAAPVTAVESHVVPRPPEILDSSTIPLSAPAVIVTPTPEEKTSALAGAREVSTTGGRPAPPSASPSTPPIPEYSPAPLFATRGLGDGARKSPRSAAERMKSALDIEEMLGTNWLNKLGIAILVLGIAFFLAYQLKTLGPGGKVLVGVVVGGVLLGAGAWFERHHRYQILARAGIGGGWALLFFTTYAMYHVPAAQVLHSQPVDLLLMLMVAGVMVWHTLRYRSQVVTGLAFLLGFLTVTVSHSNVYSLAAGAVLAAGLVVIVGRMKWFELEVFGIVASYLNHYLWLRPIIEPMGAHRHPFPEFAASVAILSLYWLIFRVSYLVRNPDGHRQERVSTAAALLNTVLLLLCFKYQSAHPEWAFWALLFLGGVEALLGRVMHAQHRRRTAVIVLTTMGVVLLIAAFPFRYSGMKLSVFWLLEAEMLLLVGVWTREIVFRRLGAAGTVIAAMQMIAVDAARICGMRSDGADVSSHPREALLFGVAAAVFYGNTHWVAARWSELFEHEIDKTVMARLSYVGALMAAVGLWILLPEAWTAVAWTALGLALLLTGRRWRIADLSYQANFVAAAAVLRTLTVNLEATTKYHGVTRELSR